ncbi:MAG TPA: tRNA lysidine(34) synthetase TilS [Kofleriaceae bacterium]|jgi:tRNA(Ile)-lysidine synthase
MPADPVATIARAVDAAIGQVTAIGVACSGGIDSMALADAAIATGRHMVVVTVDHQLQPGSADVAEGVAAWARARGAIGEIRRVVVEPQASLEAAARDARYAALDTAIAEHGLAAMLLAHTARDQAETILMRVLRGTGPAGLVGMAAARGSYLRPLLQVPRSATEAYVAARGLPTWPDPMNADATLTRVRVREQLLPLLRGENPALDDALIRLGASTHEWLEAIDQLAAPFARFPIACSALAEQPAAIRKRALARALDAADIGYDAVHLDQLDRLACAPARGEVSIDLPNGRLVRSYDVLAPAVVASATEQPTAPVGYELRAWRAGDRMCPARLGGRSKKLSDLYGDAKIPRAAREHARVLVRLLDGTIVWAEHVGRAYLAEQAGDFEQIELSKQR